jgi:hypothetical protein
VRVPGRGRAIGRVYPSLSSIQRAGAILSATPLFPPHFSALSHKRHDFRENVIELKMCFDFLYNFYLKHFSFLGEFSEILS